ncbi:MAG: hypothetical protein AB2417_04035 [Clostridiaceae bacterium]
MKNKKIEKLLNSYQPPDVSNEQMKNTIFLAKQELNKKQSFLKASFIEVLREQIKYISPVIWIAQLIVLCLTSILLWYFGNDVKETISVFSILSISAPIVALIGIPEIAKSFTCNMWEIEQYCRYNLQKIMAIRMVIIGATDLISMSILFSISAFYYDGNILSLILYVLVPFNISSIIYLFIFNWVKGKTANYTVMAIGLFLAVGFSQLSKYPKLYQSTSIWIWGVLFVITSLLLIWKIAETLNSMKNKEELLWNLQ